jgi:hypothetical protein
MGIEPAVSRCRWILALLAGLVVWLVLPSLAPSGDVLLGNLISTVLAVIVAGLIIGARSVRQWLIVGPVVAGLVTALFALSVLLIPWLSADRVPRPNPESRLSVA